MMDNAIKIGNEISEGTATHLKGLIESVFRVGAETRMEQETIREALNLIRDVHKVENISISGSTFKGDTHLHADEGTPAGNIQ